MISHFLTNYRYRHVWQLIAHYMGIKDEYNLCSGDIDQVRRRTKDILEVIVKPTLRDIDAEWEHMCRCAFDGFSFFFPIFEFELPLQILCQILNIQTPCFNKSLTFKQRSAFHFFRLALGYFFRVPGVLTFANYFFRHYLKRYKELTPEERRSVEEKQYPYMNQPFKKQLVWPFSFSRTEYWLRLLLPKSGKSYAVFPKVFQIPGTLIKFLSPSSHYIVMVVISLSVFFFFFIKSFPLIFIMVWSFFFLYKLFISVMFGAAPH